MARGRPKGFTMSDEQKAAMQAGRSKENKTHFQVGKKWRVYSSDERNWTLQKNNGTDANGDTIWVSKHFYGSLNSLLRALATKLINKEMKTQGNIEDFAELAKRMEAVETKVLDELREQLPEDVKKQISEVKAA